jgi:hypothetical protein
MKIRTENGITVNYSFEFEYNQLSGRKKGDVKKQGNPYCMIKTISVTLCRNNKIYF